MAQHWAVTVDRDGEKVVTIETNCLSGREIDDQDKEAIAASATSLLAFIGEPPVYWRPIRTAPRDGSDITVFHKTHGAMTARFCAGEWHEHHEYGREYDGPVWCLGDDIDQVEVEEYPDGEFHDGPITHWMPRIQDPPPKEPCFDCGTDAPCDGDCPNAS